MGLLGDIFSTIDSAKRRASAFGQGLLSDPVETVRQQVANNNNEAGQNLDALGSLYKDAQGKVTFNRSLWSPQAVAANDSLTNQLTGAMMGATVWHGSPHAFNKFDSSKIGTGEGAQVYGHGLYLADSPDVAKFYQGVHGTPGALYKVDLPDEHVAKMLDWDKPITEQSQAVQDALKKLTNDVVSGGSDLSRAGRDITRAFNPYTRADLLNEMSARYGWSVKDGNLVKKDGSIIPESAIQNQLQQRQRGKVYSSAGDLVTDLGTIQGSPASVSAALSNNGIPGVRYLDGDSRSAGGTSNYVVFPGNENMLTIQQRNGQPLP